MPQKPSSLTTSAMRSVINDALAIQIREYIPAELCGRLTAGLIESLGADNHDRIYLSNIPAFTDVAQRPNDRSSYLSRSGSILSRLRSICHPYSSPVDRLRCELDEVWPSGSQLLKIDGRPLVFGMVRLWTEGAGALPHMDILGRSLPGFAPAQSFTAQLGANIYLSVPETDHEGDIELWNLGIEDVDCAAHRIDGTYGFRRELLPPPDLIISPKVGDLVLLRSDRIHAVRPTSTGTRLSLSGFVGHTSPERPLLLWS